MRLRLGIDVACKAAHQVSCTDETGTFLFSGRRFRTTVDELEKLWASLPAADEVLVVLEPTRNARGALGGVATGPRREGGPGAAGTIG